MSAAGYGLDDKVSKSGDTMSGPLILEGTPPLTIPSGAGSGKLATSDADGNVSWEAAPATTPLTTLGDILYENSTPAQARLAGNTTTTRKFLRQTGTGSASAAPAWDTLQAADIPGVDGVTITGTPAEGQVLVATGTSAAKWADAPVDWLNVVTQYSADPTGSADSTTAIQNAIAAAVSAGGGVVYLPAGTYKIAGNISQAVTNTPVYIIGDGRWCTFLNFTGTGACLRLYDTQVAGTSTNWGGCIKGITIDGTSHTSTAASGLHIGDLFQYELDVVVQNFTATGDIGVHLDSQYFYTEQLRGDIFISNCATGVAFDANSTSGNVTGSFYRADLNIWLNQNTYAYNGVTFLNGTYIVDGALHIRGNFTGGSSGPTSSGPWVLGLTGEGPVGRQDAGTFSFLAGCNLDIQVECDSTAAHGPYDIYFDASFTGYITNTYGVLDFLVAETTTFTACNAPGQISNYWGPTNGDTFPNLLPLMNSNLGSGTQLINSTTAANITNLTLAVGATFTAYRIKAYIPYSSTVAAGTPVFAFAGPAIAVINVNYQFQTASTPWVGAPTITTSSPTMTGPTLSTAAGLALLIEGTIAFSAAGTFAITAKEGTASDTFTIGAGAYVELILQNTG